VKQWSWHAELDQPPGSSYNQEAGSRLKEKFMSHSSIQTGTASTVVDPEPFPALGQQVARRAGRIAAILAGLLMMIGLPLLTTAPANASVAGCWDGRCTIYLSINETKALGAGRIPAPPSWVPWQIRTAYYASAYAHKYFAYKYGSWNYCSAFTLNIRPWATQGYYGYRCNWW
jgi:hypothetical protein